MFYKEVIFLTYYLLFCTQDTFENGSTLKEKKKLLSLFRVDAISEGRQKVC